MCSDLGKQTTIIIIMIRVIVIVIVISKSDSDSDIDVDRDNNSGSIDAKWKVKPGMWDVLSGETRFLRWNNYFIKFMIAISNEQVLKRYLFYYIKFHFRIF